MFFNIIGKISILIIRVYQKTISPDHGVFRHTASLWGCSCYPSCSEYTKTAIEEEGFVAGLKKGARRIISCH